MQLTRNTKFVHIATFKNELVTFRQLKVRPKHKGCQRLRQYFVIITGGTFHYTPESKIRTETWRKCIQLHVYACLLCQIIK